MCVHPLHSSQTLKTETTVQLKEKDWNRAKMKGEQLYRENSHLSALQGLTVRLEFFANAKRRLEEPGTTVPGDLKPTMDTLVYASTKFTDIDELAPIRDQLFARYGKRSFFHAQNLENGHAVDKVVLAGIEGWYQEPTETLVAEELDKIAKSSTPPIPFDKAEDLKSTFGRTEISPREIANALHPPPEPKVDPA